jgi:hypothetical protein
VDLLFEYFVPTRLPIQVGDSQLHPFEMPEFDLAAPAGTPLPSPAPRIVMLSPDSLLLEFQSIAGRTYTILYRDDSILGKELTAQPPIVAPGTRVQWIDNGPPKTISPPGTVGARFYRVIQGP